LVNSAGAQEDGGVVDAVSTNNVPAWETIDRRLLVDRSPYATIYDEDLRLPDGSVITNFVRVELPDFIVVFSMLEDGRVPMVRQYRQAIRGYSLELPAGQVENGEDTLAAAQRELREEAGIEAVHWEFLGKFVMDANRQCGWCYVYLATDARIAHAADPGDLGEMTLHLIALDQVRAMWQNGELVNAPTALTIGLALERLGKSSFGKPQVCD
jgi:ADP-ribose pyrophosphatase